MQQQKVHILNISNTTDLMLNYFFTEISQPSQAESCMNIQDATYYTIFHHSFLNVTMVDLE